VTAKRSILAEKAKPASWKQVRQVPVSSRIAQQIRDAVFAGKLKPGDYVGSEMDLAQQFGVSRIPVRDAMKTLAAMGIVEIKVGAGGGARVAHGDLTRFAGALAVQFKLAGITVAELLDSQIAIESAGAALAAERATAEDIAELELLLARLAAQMDDAHGFTVTALSFHFRVVQASHNRALTIQSQALVEVLDAIYQPQTTPEVAADVVTRHRHLVKLIKSRDAAGAGEAMTQHLLRVRRGILKDIEVQGVESRAARA
jgi:GntR family transcriptional regulator, transcriptional repressor for pyruvate dehydrogenase complex